MGLRTLKSRWLRPLLAGCFVVVSTVLLPTVAVADETEATQAEQQDGMHQPADAQARPFDRFDLEQPTFWSRGELAAGLTIHGAATGVQACMMFDCRSTAAVAATTTAGAAVGMTGGLLWSRYYDVTHGRANAINSGGLWGTVAGIGAGVLSNVSHPTAMGLTIGGRLTGIAAGYLLAETLRPTAGDVALVNLGAVWAGASYLLLTSGALGLEMSPQLGFGTLLAASTLGGAVGAATTRIIPMSRTRTSLISASGLFGAFAGLAAPAIATGGDAELPALSTGALIGTVAGLTAGGFFTRNFDDPEQFERPNLSLSVTPSSPGTHSGVSATVSGRF